MTPHVALHPLSVYTSYLEALNAFFQIHQQFQLWFSSCFNSLPAHRHRQTQATWVLIFHKHACRNHFQFTRPNSRSAQDSCSFSLQFIVLLFGLLVFQLEFFSGNFTVSIPVLIGEHIFNNLFKIKTRSQFSFARINLSLNVLWKLGGEKGRESSWQRSRHLKLKCIYKSSIYFLLTIEHFTAYY